MVLFDFLSSFWLWLILSLFVARWVFSLVSRKRAVSDREDAVAAKERALAGKAKELSDREAAFANNIERQTTELTSRGRQINDAVRTRAVETVRSIAERPYLRGAPAFSTLHEDRFPYARLTAALTQDMKIEKPFDISASVHSSSGEVYDTTLYKCSCPDFRARGGPCKHMIRLAVEVGLLISYDTSATREEILTLSRDKDSLERAYQTLLRDAKRIEAENAAAIRKSKEDQSAIIEAAQAKCRALEKRAEERAKALDRIYNERAQSFPWLAKLYADLYQTYDENWILYLRNKNRPAKQTAPEVRKLIHGELREWRLRAKQSEYQLNFYESLFPWLLDFKEAPPLEAFEYVSAADIPGEEKELCRGYLSPEEWAVLPDMEKYQLALDRYIARKKSNWEVGIEYERYIGYLCEMRGYRVRYYGAAMKKEDMGRDLILERDGRTVLVQCKRWAKEKTVRENHVFQLAGSVFEYQYSHPDIAVTGAFVSTTGFSLVAALCAERTGIELFPSVPFREYPRVKCNIGRSGQKIFHLPMDQQYDNVRICEEGECYVSTVKEAMSLGFRRAYRWRGTSE